MEVKLIAPEQAKKITDKELFDRISSDHLQYEDWEPSSDWLYLGLFDPALIGYVMVHPDNDNTMIVHINILKDHRNKGMSAATLALNALNENLSENYQKLICKIPVVYPDVYHFAKKIGFKDEGVSTKSIMKNGVLVDQYMLGLERVEI